MTPTAAAMSTRRARTFYVRALFTHDPSRDSAMPGRGVAFAFGDVLHVLNAADDEWWQARRVAPSADTELGLIPSRRRVERRERARQRRVNFGKSLLFEPGLGYSSSANNGNTSKSHLDISTGTKKRTKVALLSIFKRVTKKNTAHSADDLNDHERQYNLNIKSDLNPT